MKEQDETPEEQPSELKAGYLPGGKKKFRVMTVKTIQNIGKRKAHIEKMQEIFNKELEDWKNKQMEMNNNWNEKHYKESTAEYTKQENEWED